MSLNLPQIQILEPMVSEAFHRQSFRTTARLSPAGFLGPRMNFADWERLVESVTVGDFAIPITAKVDRRQGVNALVFYFRAKVKDVEKGFPTSIAKQKLVPCVEAFSMDHQEADHFLREEIRDIVLHELAEWLTIGGRREDPHADEFKYR